MQTAIDHPNQMFEDFLTTPTGRVSNGRKIANNTRCERITGPNGYDSYAIRFHQTVVVLADPMGNLTLNTGGWYTISTRRRINDYLPKGIRLRSFRNEWYIERYWRDFKWNFERDRDEVTYQTERLSDFYDGIVIQVNPVAAPFYSGNEVRPVHRDPRVPTRKCIGIPHTWTEGYTHCELQVYGDEVRCFEHATINQRRGIMRVAAERCTPYFKGRDARRAKTAERADTITDLLQLRKDFT